MASRVVGLSQHPEKKNALILPPAASIIDSISPMPYSLKWKCGLSACPIHGWVRRQRAFPLADQTQFVVAEQIGGGQHDVATISQMPQKESDYIPRMHLEVLDNLRKDDYVKSFSEVGLVEMIIVQVDRMDFIEPVHSDPYSGAVGNADPRLREQPAHYREFIL